MCQEYRCGFALTLSMNQHINSVTNTCYFHLFHISKIRPYLTEAAAGKVVCSFVLSHIEYVKSIILGLPDMFLNKLQAAQHHAACMCKDENEEQSCHPSLEVSIWLPVRRRTKYKILLLTFQGVAWPRTSIHL